MSEEAIRRKLLADGEVNGDDRRINILHRNFLQLAKKSAAGGEEGARAWEAESGLKLLGVLEQVETAGRKAAAVREMVSGEVSYYSAMEERLGLEMEVAQSRMEEAKRELEEAKRIRRHRQEYQLLCGRIRALPGRKETRAKLAATEADKEEARRRLSQLHSRLALRRKQFRALLLSLQELQATVSADGDIDAGQDDKESLPPKPTEPTAAEPSS